MILDVTEKLNEVNDSTAEPMEVVKPDDFCELRIPSLNFAATDSENSQTTPSLVSHGLSLCRFSYKEKDMGTLNLLNHRRFCYVT